MARTNKYVSLNFNDIYEKKNNRPSSSSPSLASPATLNPQKTHLSTARTHGGMLVLTRLSPKPHPQPQPSPSPPPPPLPPKLDSVQTHLESDSISLRPLGRTGSSLSPSQSPVSVTPEKGLPSPKPGTFVPPHLRPGFAGREERFVGDGQRQLEFQAREFHGNHGEDRCPKSGGYERMRRGGGGESGLVEMNRPSSSGNRSSLGGWYGS